MAHSSNVNYPDILGGITGSQRANIDFIQCALTTRPTQVAAGQTFEIVLLIQNVMDVDVDVTVEMKLPDHDKAGTKGVFFTKSNRLLVGLRPAEVGFLTLLASCSPKTTPDHYVLGLNVKTDIVSRAKTATLTTRTATQTIKPDSSGKSKPERVRHENGGGDYDFAALPEALREHIKQLGELPWDFQHKRNQIATRFAVTPPQLSPLKELKAGWTSLWTMSDHLDEYLLESRIREHYHLIRRGFTVERIFKPLYEATGRYFQEAGYPLKPAEAIYITKAMAYMLCKITPKQPNDIDPHPYWPEWYKHLVRVLFQAERLREYPIKVATEVIYFSLLKDAILHTFDLLEKHMQENFGTPDELKEYAGLITGRLEQKQALDFGKVYLPLIVGGLFMNRDVTEQGENVRDTLVAIENAFNSRRGEKTGDNEFVFELFTRALDKTLEDFRWMP